MKKGIVTVFIILGILVLGVLIWALVFNGGLAENAMNAIADPINNMYSNMVGDEGNNFLIGNGEEDGEGGIAFGDGANNLGSAADNAWGE